MKKTWMNSIVTKFIVGFEAVILLTMAAFFFVYNKANEISQRATYEKMYSQAEYYMQSFDNELDHVQRLQMDFFTDRKLTFLIGPDMNISDYEKRDNLLSVKERIGTITGVSKFVKDGVLYLPKSEYRITASSVQNMYEADFEQMEKQLQYADGQIHFDGENYFVVETGVPRIQSDSIPNHLFVITFSSDQIVENLARVNTTGSSGAFVYNEREDVILEHSFSECVGEKMIPLLVKDDKEEYESVQKLEVDGKDYLVFVGGYGKLGLFIQYELEDAVMEPVTQFRHMAYVILAMITLLVVVLGSYFTISLHQAINVLLKGFERVQSGNWKEHITEERQDEFLQLYKGFNNMEDKIEQLINDVYVQTNLTQRAQMKQLQAQIAPHFLYNSFFILSSRVKKQDYENAEKLAKHLGAYFRYLTRNESDYVPLKYEVEHAMNYAAIQGARFINRIRIEFEKIPPGYEQIMVPRLILQPLLENAFEYGLENKVEDGLLWVHFEENDKEWQILVEDNGEEASDEKLEEISETLIHGKQGEITGIYNIHMRLQNYFHGCGGVRVQRSRLGGTRVSVYIGKEKVAYEHEFVNS